MANIFSQLVNSNQAQVDELRRIVKKINAVEPRFRALSDGQLRNKTAEFRKRLELGETLDDLLVEAVAAMREASRRTINRRAYDVQCMGAIVLHRGMVDDQKTGEGKTTVATLAAYLNALPGEGVHVVTVNDYLAKRDRDHTAPAYEALGLKVGVIVSGLTPKERKAAYDCDITYGTNTEFGFDYLRDNMALSPAERVQRGHNFCIIDEIDNVLIDEARTPLIISQPSGKPASLYQKFAKIAPKFSATKNLKENLKRSKYDLVVDERERSVILTEKGVRKASELTEVKNIYDPANALLLHHLEEALKALHLFKKDRDYVVLGGKIIIVDEYTGRLQPGKRYSGGLHQAIEAKEKVKVGREDLTVASITLQNYFRLYKKLSGMSGTGIEAQDEFWKTFHLRTVAVPLNKPNIRTDWNDLVFRTERGKFLAVAAEIARLRKIGRPVLVGTRSVEKSEMLSRMLKKMRIPHKVLNAKEHAKEAKIIAKAGVKRAVTIATNMAGRGTDIVLGPGVRELGGLHVLGTERHEDRRIDNQLRGRAGRQGDPGSSQFFVSLEDDLLRLFAKEEQIKAFGSLGIPENVPLEHPLLNLAIRDAQQKIMGMYADARRYTLEFDNVLNVHRLANYSLRRKFVELKNTKKEILKITGDFVKRLVEKVAIGPDPKKWKYDRMFLVLNQLIVLTQKQSQKLLSPKSPVALNSLILKYLHSAYEVIESRYGKAYMAERDKMIAISILDALWMVHLQNMEALQDAVSLETLGQMDPLIEFKIRAYEMWQKHLEQMREKIVFAIFRGY
jgi:preprotein translocase subunit SecA